MTGEKKSSGMPRELAQQRQSLHKRLTGLDLASRLNVKSGKKLLSKSSRPTQTTISSPPKAAIAVSSAKKDEVHRRRNPLNDMLGRKSGESTIVGSDVSPAIQGAELAATFEVSHEAAGADAQMAGRIAELEGALITARKEQRAMQEELEKARRHGWLSEAKDYQSVLEPQKECYPPDESNDHVLQQNFDLRYKLALLQDKLVSQDNVYRNNVERAMSNGDGEWNELRSRLHTTEKESQERLQQLLSLKSSISSLTRSSLQATDSELAESFNHLFNRIREWVISNFRRTKMDAAGLPPETVKALRTLTPAYETVEQTDRLAIYQALVSSALMRLFEERLVVGLPPTGPLAAIRLFAESLQDNGSEYREWRRATIHAIEKNEVGRLLEQGKNEALHKTAGEIARLLFTLTSVSLTLTAQSALMGILNVAADLQRTLLLQKARYRVLFFDNLRDSSHTAFDGRRMEAHNDFDSTDEDDTTPEGNFLFCVSPCLEKYGNEWGENAEVVNILLKARVCCGVV
jgi:hypothetical protein